MTNPEFVAGTLVWCNERRAERGLELLGEMPKGVREDPESCPCGKATGLYVEYTTYCESKGTREDKELPPAVVAFVAAFDNGDLPQYEA